MGDFVREVMIEYSKEVMKVGKMLLELLSEALGLNTNHLTSFMSFQLKINWQ